MTGIVDNYDIRLKSQRQQNIPILFPLCPEPLVDGRQVICTTCHSNNYDNNNYDNNNYNNNNTMTDSRSSQFSFHYAPNPWLMADR